MSATALNKTLQSKNIIYKVSGVWVLASKYENKGYAKLRTFPYTTNTGETKTSSQTYWTEQGRQFIHQVVTA